MTKSNESWTEKNTTHVRENEFILPLDQCESIDAHWQPDFQEPNTLSSVAERIRQRRNIDPNFDLIFAIFTSALVDIGVLRHGGRRNSIHKCHWRDAVEWITSPSEALHSFRWACGILGLDPEGTLMAIRKQHCHLCSANLVKDYCLCRWKRNESYSNPIEEYC